MCFSTSSTSDGQRDANRINSFCEKLFNCSRTRVNKYFPATQKVECNRWANCNVISLTNSSLKNENAWRRNSSTLVISSLSVLWTVNACFFPSSPSVVVAAQASSGWIRSVVDEISPRWLCSLDEVSSPSISSFLDHLSSTVAYRRVFKREFMEMRVRWASAVDTFFRFFSNASPESALFAAAGRRFRTVSKAVAIMHRPFISPGEERRRWTAIKKALKTSLIISRSHDPSKNSR
ncbi:unnamed protein product [Phytomonas sp. Hart1]|nr:unnamed protein product [Phytomonas sp. Hart1]|eukprot:CCW69999.1 unnamed protein product [Phytomonas sp. isolate Hart1]